MLLHIAEVCADESWKLFQFFLSLCFSPLCSVDDVLGQSLDEVIRQGLLDPLVLYLTSPASGSAITGSVAGVSNANSNSVTSGSGGGISNTAASVTSGGQRSLAASVQASGCSAAESSSKEEEERDLSRQG